MTKGLDNGYDSTKDSNLTIFKSAYSTVDQMITGSKHITIDGKNCYVGVGSPTVDIDKTDTEITKACTLTNLAMSGDNDYYLVVGLPISQYKSQHDKFKETILNYNKCEVIYNNTPLRFTIKEVTVHAQGIGAFYSHKIDNDGIMFDIGGFTIDTALIEMINGVPTIKISNTWFKGVLTLFSSVIQQVNTKFNLTLEPYVAEKILLKGLSINGEKQDITFLQDVLDEYLKPIIKEFCLLYPYKTTDIYICGGGGSLLFNVLKRIFPSAILLPNSQFANAIGFGKIAENLYSKYDQVRNVEDKFNIVGGCNYNYGRR